MQFKRNLSICAKWVSKLKVQFYLKGYWSKFILTSAFICLQSSFLFHHGKVAMKTYTPSHFSVITGNTLVTIVRFTCYHLLQEHFHDWFYVLRYNSDLLKLEWTLLLFNFNYICDLAIDANCFPFELLNMLPFHTRLGRTLKITFF